MNIHQFTDLLQESFDHGHWQRVDLDDDLGEDQPIEDEGIAEKRFNTFLSHLQSKAEFVGGKLKVYRAMSFPDVGEFVKSLKKKKIGVAWTFDKSLARPYRRSVGSGGTYILEALIDPKEIDEDMTVALAVEFTSAADEANMLEGEIRLAEGATVHLQKISQNSGKYNSNPISIEKEAHAESEGEADSAVLEEDMDIDVSEDEFQRIRELVKSKPETGIFEFPSHRLIIKKKEDRLAGWIKFSEWYSHPKGGRRLDAGERWDESARIDYIWVDPRFRRIGVGKELLLHAINTLGVVESNRLVTEGGEALWNSIEKTPGITIDYNDDDEHGFLAWRNDIAVAADLGSGMSGPNGYKRITEIEFDEKGTPETREPYHEYPWSPKSKESLPETAPEAPSIDDYSFPFRGEVLHRLPFNRTEDRVNKNPNTKQTFVKRAMETRKGAQAAPETTEDGIPKQGPQAPPRVPGQPDEKPAAPGRKQTFFPEFLAKVKQAFPEIKETFTKPPTYIWNPKEGAESKLDIKKYKDLLRMKVPTLKWSSSFDGVETAQVDFPDMTYADIAIGQDANHLTITYHIEGK